MKTSESAARTLGSLMQRVADVSGKMAKDVDLKRENANVDGDVAMGQMLRFGSETAKAYYLNYLIDPKFAEAHLNGDIHIHDLDFYAMTTTCCQIDLLKLLSKGFSTGHGSLREPQTIGSAAALACIAIQSNQNDQHGGQSIPNFDYGLAPYVEKSFRRNYMDALIGVFEGALTGTTALQYVAEWVENMPVAMGAVGVEFSTDQETYRASWDDEELEYLGFYVAQDVLEKDEVRRLRDVAWNNATQKTYRETYQAMEALIHNLNTMHCLRSQTKVWTRLNGDVDLLSVGELFERFENEPFEVLSVNRQTHQMEWKSLLKVAKLGAGRDMVKITTASGQEVETTDNHLYLNYEDGAIVDVLAKNVEQVLSPRGFALSNAPKTIDVSGFASVQKNSPFQETMLRVSEEFAKLLGLYVGDGSICGGSQMVLTICDKVGEDEVVALVEQALGFKPTYKKLYYGDNKLKEYRFNVGRRIANALKHLCGPCACDKKVPSFVLEGTDAIKKAFLLGYQTADGCKTRDYFEASSVSRDLISGLRFLLLQLKEYPTTGKKSAGTGSIKSVKPLYTIMLGKEASKRLGLVALDVNPACEAPKYNLRAVSGYGARRRSGNVLYREFEAALESDAELRKKHGALVNYFVGDVKNKTCFNSNDENVYDLSVEDNENFLTEDCVLIHNSRAGAQVPFSSINYGTDTSAAGRMVTECILLALEAGLGNGETPIFPIHIFRVKEGVNFNEGDKNYDLFQLACKVSAKRLFPNFSFQDAPFNLRYYREDAPETEISYMGCRTRVIGNVYDPENEIAFSRGNLSFTSINLPRLAIEFVANRIQAATTEDAREIFAEDMKLQEEFVDEVLSKLDLCVEQLLERFALQSARTARNFPFLIQQGCWLDGEKLGHDEQVGEILKHGTLSVGFIGLAETLTCLFGRHHGESLESQAFGLYLITKMRDALDARSQKAKLNFTLLATPAEGLSGRFVKLDRKKYGEIKGVTDKEYYTNSFHVPVDHPITINDKISLEAPYHELTNAGHITYVEVDGAISQNPRAFEKIIRRMKELGVGYGAINHPVDRDPICGYDGVIEDACPRCGRKETQDQPFERIRRITGYLVGTLDRFNDAKRAEESQRVKHQRYGR